MVVNGPVGHEEPNSGPLPESWVILIAKPSLQPPLLVIGMETALSMTFFHSL